jgi:hypothetical protein
MSTDKNSNGGVGGGHLSMAKQSRNDYLLLGVDGGG